MDPARLVAPPPLAVSLTGLTFEADPRRLLHWAAATGFRSVQLNAAAPGLRPRELDRSARRDLAALLRRLELRFSGVDLLIPGEHFTQADRADRAMTAAGEALSFAADLASLLGGPARPAVSMTLWPARENDAGDESILGALATSADRVGAAVADLSWPARAVKEDARAAVGVALDPAALLLAGADPAMEAARLGPALLGARLSDIAPAGRVAPGKGRLDADAYTVSLVTAGYSRDIVLDLRSLPEQQRVAEEAVARWGSAR